MARSRSRPRRGSKPAKSRRSKKKVEESIEEVEVLEESKRLGIDDGIVLVTTILLLVAFFLTDYLLGVDYEQGLMFKGKFGG